MTYLGLQKGAFPTIKSAKTSTKSQPNYDIISYRCSTIYFIPSIKNNMGYPINTRDFL